MKKKIYLIGNGPSLNKVDVKKLKNEDTISFNRAYIAYEDWGFYPTYYSCIDGTDLSYNFPDIKKLVETSSIKKYYLLDRNEHSNSIKNSNVVYIPMDDSSNVIPGYGDSVAFRVLPILYDLGYREIILLGCDCKYTDTNAVKEGHKRIGIENNDIDHFRPDYFGAGVEYGKPLDYFPGIWRKILQEIKNTDLKIYSSVPDGIINEFMTYIDFETSLKYERIADYFNENKLQK